MVLVIFLGDSQFLTTSTILLIQCDVLRRTDVSSEDPSVSNELGIGFGVILHNFKLSISKWD